jgi:hypothetical protein
MGLLSKINLREGEKIMEIIRPSHMNYLGRYILAAIIILSASFSSFWLIRQGLYGTAVLISCALASFVLVVSARRRRNSNYWILTTERLADLERRSIFHQITSQIEFDEIGDVYIRRKGMDFILGLGCVVVASPEDGIEFSLDGVRHSNVVADFIAELVNFRRRSERTEIKTK